MNCQKQLFELPNDVHYLNCAYMSPNLRSVEKAGIKGVTKKREPWTFKPEHFFNDSDRLRKLFAQVVNAGRSEDIAILPSVSYGMATVAKNLPASAGREIVIAGEQFPSNVYSWRRFCDENNCELTVVEAPEKDGNRGEKWNYRILEAITSDTLMVALSNVHWADGTRFDLKSISKAAKVKGAYLVIDGTQSVGALPLDLQEIEPDALICAGYKWLLGPYGIAIGYFGPRLSDGIPLEEGWIARKNSRDFSSLVRYREEYQPGAVRFDVGERSNPITLPMMIAALHQITEWGPGSIQNYCKELTGGMIQSIESLGYRVEAPKWRGHHMFGVRLPGNVDIKVLQQKLSDRNIHVSVRGSSVRISPNVYNNKADMDALEEVLTGLAR